MNKLISGRGSHSDNLVKQLARDYPQLNFKRSPSGDAWWSFDEQTIYYNDDELQTLHELGHALLQHRYYNQDIELLRIERAAWEVAKKVAPEYHLEVADEEIELALDSYRDWLHNRSKCPQCGQTGIQSHTSLAYSCPNCQAKWIANGAKKCALRRKLI